MSESRDDKPREAWAFAVPQPPGSEFDYKIYPTREDADAALDHLEWDERDRTIIPLYPASEASRSSCPATVDAMCVDIAKVLVEQNDPIGQNEVFMLALEILRLSALPESASSCPPAKGVMCVDCGNKERFVYYPFEQSALPECPPAQSTSGRELSPKAAANAHSDVGAGLARSASAPTIERVPGQQGFPDGSDR